MFIINPYELHRPGSLLCTFDRSTTSTFATKKLVSKLSRTIETAEGQNFVLPQKIFFPVLPQPS